MSLNGALTRRNARGALKNGYFRALAAARMDRVMGAIRARRGETLVLNLHRVAPEPNPYWPALPPEAFEALVANLDATCEILTFAELARARPSERLRVVLSFDDGFRDFVEYVMPILDRYGLRANQNVIVQCVETGRPPWIVRVMDALNAASLRRVRGLNVAGFAHKLEGDDERAKVRYGTLLAGYLKAIRPTEREDTCSDIEALLEEAGQDAWTPMMSFAETRTIADEHELGSHSYSHESMAGMTEREFEDELARSSEFFASLGQAMNIFAFPNGSYRADQIDVLQARGVEHVLLVDERASTVVRGAHPRITLYGDTLAELRMRGIGWRPPLGVR